MSLAENLTGVYCCRNLVNGKVYVGSSSTSIRVRLNLHRSKLRHGRHENKYFQNAWRKYGGSSGFEWQILEYCVPDLCLDSEQKWIDTLKATDRRYGYNICITARSRHGVKSSEETKSKLSAAVKKLWESEEYRNNMVNKHRGKVMSAETRLAMSKATKGKKKNLSDSARKALVTRNKNMEYTLEIRKKMSEGAKSLQDRYRRDGRMVSESTKQKISNAAKEQWANPEIREKMVAARRKRMRGAV